MPELLMSELLPVGCSRFDIVAASISPLISSMRKSQLTIERPMVMGSPLTRKRDGVGLTGAGSNSMGL